MFHHLLESGVPAPRRGGWAFASSVVHAAIIGGGVLLTLRDPVAARVVDYVDLVYLPAPVTPPRPVATITAPTSPSLPSTVSLDVPRIEFPTVTPVGMPEPSTRLSDVSTDMVGSGIIGPAGPAPSATNAIHTPAMVDRTVIPRRDNPRPDYPTAMRAAGVDGSVLVQFVVDTTGRVESASVSILRATHEQFGEAVRRWLGRTRYSPAEVAGKRVRQLVQQEVGFTLQP